MAERFAPTVVVPGWGTVAPEGWIWILGFALGGCSWAIRLVDSPEFDLRGRLLDYNKRRTIHNLEACIRDTEHTLARLQAQLREADGR